MEELHADYQLTGLFAFNRYQLSTQIPQIFTVYNTVVSANEKTIAGSRFQFIKVNKNRLGNTESININEEGFQELKIPVASLARTLFDAIYDYKRFGTLPDAYDWLKKYKNNETIIKELVKITIKFGNIGTKRRIGFVLSVLGVSEKITNQLLKSLPKTSSLIPLIPNRTEEGSINRQWGIINNEKSTLSTRR